MSVNAAGTFDRDVLPAANQGMGDGPPDPPNPPNPPNPANALRSVPGQSWHDRAEQLIGQGRGLARPWSWLRRSGAAARRLLVRLLALPVAIVAGALVGASTALGLALVPTTWPARLWRLPLAVAISLLGGIATGARLAWEGKLADTALIAALLHRFCPIVILPRWLRHNLFGLVVVTRYADVKTVLATSETFTVDTYDERMRASSGAFFLGMGPGAQYDQERALGQRGVGRDLSRTLSCVQPLSRALVEAASKRPSRTLDVMSELAHPVDLANLETFFGVPDTDNQELRGWLQTMGYFIFNFWVGGPYRAAAAMAGAKLAKHLLAVVGKRAAEFQPGQRGDALDRMLATTTDEPLIARTLGGLISGATVPTIAGFANVVDKLLDIPPQERWRLRAACNGGTRKDDDVVWQYVREAVRFAPLPPLIYRNARTSYVFCGGQQTGKLLERGALVVTAPVLANFDASVFPLPGEFNAHRTYPADGSRDPIIFGWSQHRCLGEYMGRTILTEMVKALFARDVRRLAGPEGRPTKGPAGAIPDGDYVQRLIVRVG
jgi:cytochrome P450